MKILIALNTGILISLMFANAVLGGKNEKE